jgi:hypothetical protein
LATSVAVVHSRSVLIVGVIRLHLAMRVVGLTLKAIVITPVPKRHINFFSGQIKVSPVFLKLWRTSSFLLESVEEYYVWVCSQHLKLLLETFLGQPGCCETKSVFVSGRVICVGCNESHPVCSKYVRMLVFSFYFR